MIILNKFKGCRRSVHVHFNRNLKTNNWIHCKEVGHGLVQLV